MKKYTEGRALIIVIIVMAMLLILAPAIVLSSNAEVFQTVKYEDRMQAQLYARSGIEAALGWLMEDGVIIDDFRNPLTYNKVAYLKGSLSSYSISSSEITGDADISVDIYEDDDGIHLFSTGVYNGSTKEVSLRLVMTSVGVPGLMMPNIDKALFIIGQGTEGEPVFNIIGSPTITGDFGANTLGLNSLSFGGKEYIIGSIFLHASTDDVIDSTGTVQTGSIYTSQPEWNFPIPVFPDYPDYPSHPDADANDDLIVSGSVKTVNLNGDFEFGDITLSGNSILNLDLGDGDRHIVCDNLNIISGHVNLINRGKLTIYVREGITIQGQSTMNSGDEGGSIEQLTLFYEGFEIPDIAGGTIVVGSLVTEISDFNVAGNNGIQGHLIIGGSAVDIIGTADLLTRIIYAPNAHVTLSGNGYVNGSIIAESAEMQGSTEIVYDESDISTLPPGILPTPGDPGEIEFVTTDVVTTYYWQ